MATKKQKIVSDVSQIRRNQEKLRKDNVRLLEQMKKMAIQSKRNEKAVVSGTQKMQHSARAASRAVVSGVRNMATSYLGFSNMVAGVTRALEEQKQIQLEIGDRNISVGRSHGAVIKNMKDPRTAQEFFDKLEKINIAKQFGDVAKLNLAASAVLSSTGQNESKTLEILNASAGLFRDAPEQLKEFSGVVADVQKQIQGTAEESVALIVGIQGQARLTEIGKMKNFGPAASAMRVYTEGANKILSNRFTGALFAGIGNQIGDTEGNITKTAVVALGEKLEKLYPELSSNADKLKRIRSESGEFKQSFVANGFERQVRGVILELVRSKDTQTAKAVQSAFNNIQVAPEKVTRMENALLEATPELKALASEANRTINNRTHDRKTFIGEVAKFRQDMEKNMVKTRALNPLSAAANFMFENIGNMTIAGTAGEQLTQMESMINNRLEAVLSRQGIFTDISLEKSDAVEILVKMLATLEGLRTENKRFRAARKSQAQEEMN